MHGQHQGNTEGKSEELAGGKTLNYQNATSRLSSLAEHLQYWNTDPFTSDKLSSNLVLNVWLGTLLRPSVTFSIDCSTLLQEPVEEQQQKLSGCLTQNDAQQDLSEAEFLDSALHFTKNNNLYIFPKNQC